ncbi:MAG TPA: hypothetical protein VFQ76_17120 [Longimicrobiaceae bacterium]|nr:hypothetical protein [Longimicrobiaceae bacterium]
MSAPTHAYVTVEYDARRAVLTYTNDASPRWTPPSAQFAGQLALAAGLADVNARVNPAR